MLLTKRRFRPEKTSFKFSPVLGLLGREGPEKCNTADADMAVNCLRSPSLALYFLRAAYLLSSPVPLTSIL